MPILGGCLCCDLKVGTKIIGVFHLIAGLASTLTLIVAVLVVAMFSTGAQIAQDQYAEEKLKLNKDVTKLVNDLSDDYNLDDSVEQQQEVMKMITDHMDTVLIVVYIFLGLAILKVITTSMLIHGVRNDRRGFLCPFIVQETLNNLAVIGLLITVFVFLGANKITGAFAASILVSVMVAVYCILVVVSQYQALGLIRMHEEICMK